MTTLPPELARQLSQHRRIKDVEAALLLGVSVSVLRNARSTGKGAFAKLPYCKLGSAIRYCVADVIAFAESCKVER